MAKQRELIRHASNLEAGTPLTPTQVYNYARQAGWGVLGAQAVTIVVFAESSGKWWAVNPSPCGSENGRTLHAVGLAQICNYSSRGTTEQLKDPVYNLEVAHRLWKAAGNSFVKDWKASQETWADPDYIEDIAMDIDVPVIIGDDGSPSGGLGNLIDALVPNLPGETGNKIEDTVEGGLGAIFDIGSWFPRIAAAVVGAGLLILAAFMLFKASTKVASVVTA